MAAEPDPERDRALARRVRYGPRFAQPLADLAQRWAKSPEAVAARRHAKAIGVLRQRLDPVLAARVRCAGLRDGHLVLEAADAIAIHELRTIHQASLLAALVAAGCGVTRISVRPARSGR